MKFILAKKLNMTQIFTQDQKVVPVTVLQVLPCQVTQIKTLEKDRYEAVQIGSGKIKREYRVSGADYQVGKQILVTDFAAGDTIAMRGESKGRGFAGAVKRHGFHGAPASHGHDHPRAVGSIGMRFPQHVRPGMRMAGQMGNAGATEKKSVVVAIDAEKNLMFVKGGVPGAPNGIVEVYTVSGKARQIKGAVLYGNEKVEEAQTVAADASLAPQEAPVTPEEKPAEQSK